MVRRVRFERDRRWKFTPRTESLPALIDRASDIRCLSTRNVHDDPLEKRCSERVPLRTCLRITCVSFGRYSPQCRKKTCSSSVPTKCWRPLARFAGRTCRHSRTCETRTAYIRLPIPVDSGNPRGGDFARHWEPPCVSWFTGVGNWFLARNNLESGPCRRQRSRAFRRRLRSQA